MITKEFLENEYVINKKSVLTIAKEIKLPYNRIYNLFINFKIKKRKIGEILKNKSPSETAKQKMSDNHADFSGSKNPGWKNGIKKSWGYFYLYMPQHPKSYRKYIKKANFIMEQYIGRYLTKDEIVHHINEIRDDDRIENLMLCKNESEHQKLFH